MEKTHLKHKHGAPKILNYSILIVSDTRYSEVESGKNSTDMTIPLIKKILEKNNQKFVSFQIVPDENERIKEVLLQLIKEKNDIIIASGGTGISKRDVT
ncbi:MAG: hypothetical protein HWN67_06500, partial [Candidatus Helarchaeota archaeon]|nr:hypothetical protein [Candidatus Helarchaeota archaeon]